MTEQVTVQESVEEQKKRKKQLSADLQAIKEQLDRADTLERVTATHHVTPEEHLLAEHERAQARHQLKTLEKYYAFTPKKHKSDVAKPENAARREYFRLYKQAYRAYIKSIETPEEKMVRLRKQRQQRARLRVFAGQTRLGTFDSPKSTLMREADRS